MHNFYKENKSYVGNKLRLDGNGEVKIKSENIGRVNKFTYLGNVIDDKLTGKSHLKKTQRKVSPLIGFARRAKHVLSIEKLTQLVSSLIFPIATQDWFQIYPIMNKKCSGDWENQISKIQKTSVGAP